MKAGFTLVELLVVIAVTGVVLGLVIPSFTSFIQSQYLKQGAEQVLGDLRAAQSRSQTGMADPSGNNVCWGITIPKVTNCGVVDCTVNYDVGYSSTCNPGSFTVVSTNRLPGAVQAVAGGVIIFSRLTGRLSSAADVRLSLNSVDKHVIVEVGGNMYVQ
jgi:prepilin-type N-terminal cleavage/methylation domain-containing protein